MSRSADLRALDILLGPGSAKARRAHLARLAGWVRAQQGRVECPECGHAGITARLRATATPTASPIAVALCCAQCGTHWDAEG